MRDIPRIDHMRIKTPQQPRQHVEHDRGPRIADMGMIVDCRPADIHRHTLRIGGNEFFLPPRKRVVERQLAVLDQGVHRSGHSVVGRGFILVPASRRASDGGGTAGARGRAAAQKAARSSAT